MGIKFMEINLTLEHIFGAVVLSAFLSMFVTGQLLIRAIVFVLADIHANVRCLVPGYSHVRNAVRSH